jgi:hypothetical protein
VRATQAANDPVPTNKKKETQKRASKHVLAAEPGSSIATDKKIKPDAPVVATVVPTQGAWCPIHETNSHDLKTCRTVYGLMETRNKCFTERGTMSNVGNYYSCGQLGHLSWDCPRRFPRGGSTCGRGGGHVGAGGGHGGGRGNSPREPDLRPAVVDGGVGAAGEYQEEAAIVCIHGGAASLPILDAIKHFSREILATEPRADQREPLCWSHVLVTFDVADHPNRCTGVGALPLVVSPVIHNVRVTKMLVDGRASISLISVKLMEVLQISKKELTPTGAFRGAIPGATQPLRKVVLPITFRTHDIFWTENAMFDVAEIMLPYNGLLGRPAGLGPVHGGRSLRLQYDQDTYHLGCLDHLSGHQGCSLLCHGNGMWQQNPATSVKQCWRMPAQVQAQRESDIPLSRSPWCVRALVLHPVRARSSGRLS